MDNDITDDRRILHEKAPVSTTFMLCCSLEPALNMVYAVKILPLRQEGGWRCRRSVLIPEELLSTPKLLHSVRCLR